MPAPSLVDFLGDVPDPGAPHVPHGGRALRAFVKFLSYVPDQKDVWRTIEVRADQTLHDLHGAIQVAFDWDDDHLYSFFMSGKAWDSLTEYTSPLADEGPDADGVKIGALGLMPKQRFLYLFDYGDELRHEVRLVGTGLAVAGRSYPRIVESHGKAPPQYPNVEEDE